MARAAPSISVAVTLLGSMVVLCAGMMVMLNYAKVEIKKQSADEVTPPAGPQSPYAARIDSLKRKEYAVTHLEEDDDPGLGRYVNFSEAGLYLDIVSDEVVFSSLDKLPPLLGSAEFSRPLDPARLLEERGQISGEERLNVKGKASGVRLGWIVTEQDGSRRYVLNSSALRFVPAADLEKENLGKYRTLFPQ